MTQNSSGQVNAAKAVAEVKPHVGSLTKIRCGFYFRRLISFSVTSVTLRIHNIYLSDQKAVLVHFVSGIPLFRTDKIPGFLQVFPSNFQVI